jgi:hypothetical protein
VKNQNRVSKFKAISATFMVALFCGAMFLSPNLARAEGDDFGPTCYCDSEASGCWHDGDSGQKCSTKKECAGGKCLPKTDLL